MSISFVSTVEFRDLFSRFVEGNFLAGKKRQHVFYIEVIFLIVCVSFMFVYFIEQKERKKARTLASFPVFPRKLEHQSISKHVVENPNGHVCDIFLSSDTRPNQTSNAQTTE